jgi:hypothetical protein
MKQFNWSAAGVILTRDIVTCFSVAPWHCAQYNEAHVPKMVVGKTDSNDSLEKGLHILKKYPSKCSNDALWEGRQLSFNDPLHKAGRKGVIGDENIKYKHVVGSFLPMQIPEHDQCKRILYLHGEANRKLAFTAVLNICAICNA